MQKNERTCLRRARCQRALLRDVTSVPNQVIRPTTWHASWSMPRSAEQGGTEARFSRTVRSEPWPRPSTSSARDRGLERHPLPPFAIRVSPATAPPPTGLKINTRE
jgi:hypothetical protein